MIKKVKYCFKNIVFLLTLLLAFLFSFLVLSESSFLKAFAEEGCIEDNYVVTLEDGKGAIQEVEYTGEGIYFEGVVIKFDGERVVDFTEHEITLKYYLDGNEVFHPTNVGTYDVKIFVKETELCNNNLDFKLVILRKKFDIKVDILESYIYDGTELRANISLLPTSVSLEVLKVVYHYNEDPENELSQGSYPQKAGVYSLSFYAQNDNYVMGDIIYSNNVKKMSIKKATLSVKANDLTLSFGEEITTSYKISGYVPGENEENIDEMPTVAPDWDPSKPGIYNINYSGASAQNYDFIYIKGTLIINSPKINAAITGSNNSIEIFGNFSPDCKINFTKVSLEDKDVINSKTAFTARSMNKFNDKLLLIFDVSVTEGNYELNKNFKISVDNIVVNRLFRDSVKIIVVDKNLKPTLVSSYTLKQGELTFEVPPFEGYVFIYVEQLFVSLAIAIAALIIFLILLFIVLAKVKYENDKKEIEEKKKNKGFEWTNRKR